MDEDLILKAIEMLNSERDWTHSERETVFDALDLIVKDFEAKGDIFSAPCFAAHYRRYICLVDAAGINGRRHEFIGVLQSALPAVELYGFAVDNVVFIGEANSDSDFPEESPILLEKE